MLSENVLKDLFDIILKDTLIQRKTDSHFQMHDFYCVSFKQFHCYVLNNLNASGCYLVNSHMSM